MEHPCANGLSAACFKAHPAWAKKALAYKLLMMMLPPEVSASLPGWVGEVGASAPPGWPEGSAPPVYMAQGASVAPSVRAGGVSGSMMNKAFGAGPVRTPALNPSVKTYTRQFRSNAGELLANAGNPWATKRNTTTTATVTAITAATSPAAIASYNGAFYILNRFGMRFDLGVLPGSAEMVSGTLQIKNTFGLGITVCVQTGGGFTWGAVGDYLGFSGSAEDPKAITGGTEIYTLSATALAYLKSRAGLSAYMMYRQYSKDYLDVAPVAVQSPSVNIYTHAAAALDDRPRLELVYKA